MAAISDRNLVARMLAKILENADDLYDAIGTRLPKRRWIWGWRLRLCGLKVQDSLEGLQSRFIRSPQAWNEPSQLIIEWDDQPRKKRVFSQGDCGKLAFVSCCANHKRSRFPALAGILLHGSCCLPQPALT